EGTDPMNKIVREHYPASRLPEDLRAGIDPAREVTVTVVVDEAPPERVMSLDEIFASGSPRYRSLAEINDHVRSLREEWRDRD
ncbi:hypothetical protein ACMYL4_24120, partial [Salmonella enterica subsp. enterica serovar Typhimurium]|uniref:hypothetical protein n=1 Tax=Salmonella enterica TaxID=28901 RepID=UPI0039E7FEE4